MTELLIEYVIFLVKSLAGLLFVFSPLIILTLIIEWLFGRREND